MENIRNSQQNNSFAYFVLYYYIVCVAVNMVVYIITRIYIMSLHWHPSSQDSTSDVNVKILLLLINVQSRDASPDLLPSLQLLESLGQIVKVNLLVVRIVRYVGQVQRHIRQIGEDQRSTSRAVTRLLRSAHVGGQL